MKGKVIIEMKMKNIQRIANLGKYKDWEKGRIKASLKNKTTDELRNICIKCGLYPIGTRNTCINTIMNFMENNNGANAMG